MDAAPTDALASLRAEIDRLDDTLHDLLLRRVDVVAALAGSRAKAGGPLLRPGREAAILRRLLARHRGPLPATALARQWREIFAASTALQGAFSVALHARRPEHAALAFEHFGVAVPCRQQPTPTGALAALDRGDAAVAVLPMPEDGEAAEAAWWCGLDGQRLQIVARLPFVAAGDPGTEALVVAAAAPDPSGDDLGVLRLETSAAPTRGDLLSRCAAAGFDVRSLLLRRDGGRGFGFVVVAGAVAAADPRLAALDVERALPLGFYAAPVRGQE